jgi:hypothetical protein
MVRRLLAIVALGVVWTSPAPAQEVFTLPVPPPPGGAAGTQIFVGRGGPGDGAMDLLQPAAAGELLFVEPLESAASVTDAPYTAEAITESTQALADGNRISRRSSVQVARDGRGRERREHQAMVVGPIVARRSLALVTISDPATGVAVTIDHERQLATRMRMRRWAGAPGAPGGPSPPGGPPRAGIGLAYPPMRGSVTSAQGSTMQWTAAAGSDVTMAVPAFPVGESGERRTETLEPQMIEGVRAEGTRTTVTIAAGAIGNDLPIEIVSERWFSPELKTVVLSRRHDPRFGETVFRLASLVRGEPSADLFEIPAGYRIDDAKGPPLPH